jgi:peptidoglycan/xylan/chitin deacetylase (PgdA/CDA1 family)
MGETARMKRIGRLRSAGAVAAAGAALLVTALTGCQGSSGKSQAGGTGAAPTPSAAASATNGANDGIPASGRASVDQSIEHSTASGGRTVALTFDDGPNPVWTPRILAVLAQYHAHATFCEIGPQAKANPQMVKEIIAAGDRLCDHSVSHNEAMDRFPKQRQVYEIVGAKQMIEQAGGAGTEVDWFRAPGGDFSPQIRAISASNGLRPLGWTVDTKDWARPGVAAILANVRRELRPGGIILMHDGGGDRTETCAALRQLLPWLIQNGYAFDFPGK